MNKLEEAIQIIANGNQTRFAEIVSASAKNKLSQQLVSYWVKTKSNVSPKFTAVISDLTGGQIEMHELNNDFPKNITTKAA